MATIKDPCLFSAHFGVRPAALAALGVLDPTLNVDTRLFIDPLLVEKSRKPEMRRAADRFRRFFEEAATLLAASKQRGDVPWRTVKKRFTFPEVRGTCLGYGSASTAGSGFGDALTETLLTTAKEIIDLGVLKPELFLLLALLEDGVGPDRISDMTTNVILSDLAEFTQRVSARVGVPTVELTLGEQTFRLPENPFSPDAPVLLVPKEVLRQLPIVTSWSEVSRAASSNNALRARVNKRLGALWYEQSRQAKADLKAQALSSKDSVEMLLDVVNRVDRRPYDLNSDPSGVVTWHAALGVARKHPLELALPPPTERTVDDVHSVVLAIVSQFTLLVEDKGLWKDLWNGNERRPEKAAQRLFLAVADSYCKANDLDLAPETDAGGGPVDFKLSAGAEAKVLVEIKLSSNSKVVDGYTKQLEVYKAAENARRAVYLVIDVGGMGEKRERLRKLERRARRSGGYASDIAFVNGKRRRSASKQ